LCPLLQTLVVFGENMFLLNDPSAQSYMFQAIGLLLTIYAALCIVAKFTWPTNAVDFYALPLGGYVPKWFKYISWFVIALAVGLFFIMGKNAQINGLQL
jgi:hypothetical protein